MATLKGQNLRILTIDETTNKAKCIAMATSCTITLTGNADSAETKDDVGMASKPTITSKSWSVQVESLDVSDAGAMLTAIKSLTPFTLMWDQTLETDNQTYDEATFARQGKAFINDLTLNFNDRENSAKSVQLMGTSGITTISTPTIEMVTANSYTKGQFVRLLLGDNNTDAPTKFIAGAKQLSLHVSLTMEDATTKDTEGDWVIQEPTALSYDISTTALVRSGESIKSSVSEKGQDVAAIETIYTNGTPVKWIIGNVSGDNQRVLSTTIVSGSCLLTQLTLNGPNRANADYSATLNGYGDYTVAA
jgi:predicted secreted protein